VRINKRKKCDLPLEAEMFMKSRGGSGTSSLIVYIFSKVSDPLPMLF
jgi:hypothetical protein